MRYFKALSDDKARSKYAYGCLIGNLALEVSDSSAETRSKLADIFQRWERPIIVCLREAQAKKELAPDRDIQDLASVVIESWEGAVMRAKVEQRRAPLRRFEDIVLPNLLTNQDFSCLISDWSAINRTRTTSLQGCPMSEPIDGAAL